MTSIDHLVGILATSACFWVIFWFYTFIRIQSFIVKRYEQETDLLDTVFFQNHVPFARYLPNFFSAEIYSGHLTMCLWGWRYFRTKKVFKDIKDSAFITKHFNKKEIRKVKRCNISILILIFHGIAYYIFKFIWPEVFD